MLNEFLSSVKGELLEQLRGETKIDPNQMNAVSEVVTDSFKDGLLDKLKQGRLTELTTLFGKSGHTSPFAASLVSSTVASLISKLGLSPALSSSVANKAVPFIIEQFGVFASAKGFKGEEGIRQLLGKLASGSIKDNLLGGLSSKFGF